VTTYWRRTTLLCQNSSVALFFISNQSWNMNNQNNPNKRCIFCKADSSKSKSVEHIIPESLGSKRRLLPAGVVCDKCNNYFARKVEEPVLNHSWMRNLRAWHQVPGKKGSCPSLVGHIFGTNVKVNMKKSKNGEIIFSSENRGDASELERVVAEDFDRPLIFTIEDDVPQKEMSRFLCKMALETCAELFCKDQKTLERVIDEPFYDRIRTYVRYGNSPDYWPFHQRTLFPMDTLMLNPETNEWVGAGFGCTIFMTKRNETFFAFLLYGVEFVINVGGPSLHGYEEWLINHAGISPMVERVGCRLVIAGEGELKKHYLEGNFDSMAGFTFDRNSLRYLAV
jgi:hypothetical protein